MTSVEEVYRAYNEAENSHDLRRTRALVSEELAVTVNGVPSLGSAADDERATAVLLQAYPDYRRELVEVLGVGGRGFARWRMRGTPAAGQEELGELDVHGCSVVTVADGRIVAADLYVDSTAVSVLLERARAEEEAS